MPNTRFDRFYRQRTHPPFEGICQGIPRSESDLQSIGKSYEGRDVWLVTATNFRSGEDAEKPALWVDANLHASEVTGSTAALYLIHTLVTRYKIDANVTRAQSRVVADVVSRHEERGRNAGGAQFGEDPRRV